jgi:hypothetical protein
MRNTLFAVPLLTAIVTAASFDYSGDVSNSSGSPISGVMVQIEGSESTITTDSDGHFGEIPTAINLDNIQMSSKSVAPSISNGKLSYNSNFSGETISLSIYSLAGQLLYSQNGHSTIAGKNSLLLPTSINRLATAITITQVAIGNSSHSFKTINGSGRANAASLSNVNRNAVRRSRATKTLIISKDGYETKELTVSEADSLYQITLSSHTNDYPEHSNIIASYFWVGEGATSDNHNISNVSSSWDGQWGTNYGVEDSPDSSREPSSSIKAYFLTSSSYESTQNPYYCALPYNDFGTLVSDLDLHEVFDKSLTVDGESWSRKSDRKDDIYWGDEKSWKNTESLCKNKWIRVEANAKVCFVQWEDAGPFYYNDVGYVFGDDSPANRESSNNLGAGIDLSPAAYLYLKLDMDEGFDDVSWQFVDEIGVPNGPWRQVVTKNGRGGWPEE